MVFKAQSGASHHFSFQLFSRYLHVICLVCSAAWTGTVVASPTPWGLDQRPQNLSCVAPARPTSTSNVSAERVFANIVFKGIEPVSMQQPPGDPTRWFMAGRLGEIYSFANDQATSSKQLILDITDRMQFTDMNNVSVDSQQSGISSIAVHPQFATQPYIYVTYNARPSVDDDVYSFLSRFTSTDGGLTFDSTSEEVLLSILQIDSPSHHIGQIVFGPDSYLYVGLGDGGWRANASSNLNDLRGSILRLDIDNGLPYTIPADNPLVGTSFKSEIYAWGFRHPWRFTFDRDTGDLWLGDVGQREWEEINKIKKGGDYGWPILEGNECFVLSGTSTNCDSTPYEAPVIVIEHPTARAVIAGYVYRGNAIPSLVGTFIFGDAVNADIRGMFYDSLGEPFWDVLTPSLNNKGVTTFAEDLDGEIYYIHFRGGEMFKLIQANPNPLPSTFPELLSETGCVDPADPLNPAPGLIPFSVNTPLWSDGAEKDRWMAIPDGATIDILPDGDFDFPAGTVLMKRFSFNNAPIETRLFIRHNDGFWAGYSFEWRDDLSDAELLPAGKTKQVTSEVTWKYPSRNECLDCHTDAANFPLGPEVIQLNGPFMYPTTSIVANQLITLDHIGMFTNGLPDQLLNLKALVPLSKMGAPVERKARSYLHSNCSGCHRPGGSVQSNVDFRFSTPIEAMNVCDMPPFLGDLGVPGARLLKPGEPQNSVISLRMHSLDINRMPLLGSAIIDPGGTGVVDSWISQLDVCNVYPDTDGDLVRDNVDNCTMAANSHQSDTDDDGYGNYCDADFDNNLIVNAFDLSFLRSNFFRSDPDADLNGDGFVNAADLGIMKSMFFKQPGPSGIAP